MASNLLTSVHGRLLEHLEDLRVDGDGLSARIDARYGDLLIQVDHDEEAESLRVSAAISPPPGAGAEFLLFCLATNCQYWDVKIGLEDDGHILVHSDIELDDEPSLEDLPSVIVDRSDSIIELLDDDMTEWLLSRRLGSPAQLKRWLDRPLEVELLDD